MVRVLASVFLVLVLTGCSSGSSVVPSASSSSVLSSGRPVASPGVEPSAIAILRGWDRRRAKAYALGDVDALRRLYVAGSVARARDARVLTSYAVRGLAVREMTRQLFAVRVLAHGPRVLRLRVTDRLVRAVAVGDAARVRLPRTRVMTRTMVLRRVGRDWLVASVGR